MGRRATMGLTYRQKVRALVDELGLSESEAEEMLEDMGEDCDD